MLQEGQGINREFKYLFLVVIEAVIDFEISYVIPLEIHGASDIKCGDIHEHCMITYFI